MKTKIFLFLFFVCCAFSLSAQNPLVGTWEMHLNGTRSFKIITPTHWAVFTDSAAGDNTVFLRSQGGTYTIKGDKYVESFDVASWENYDKDKTDFTFKVEGDKFYQKGSITFGDGTVYPIDEVWQKVKVGKANAGNKGLGTWDQLSSSYTMADGTKESHTNATATRYQVVTPTHWIRISHRDNKFENVMGGTYTVKGNQVYPNIDFASFPIDKNVRYEITQEVKGDKMYWTGVGKDGSGKQVAQFEDVFQKLGNKKLARVTTQK